MQELQWHGNAVVTFQRFNNTMFLRQPQRHWVLQVLASLSDTMNSVCQICECWELEQYFHSHSTSAINILQRKRYLPPPTKNPSPVWGKGRHVHRCWSGKGRWLAQTMGSPSALMASVSNYVSTPCLVACPLCKEDGHYKRLSPITFLPLIQEAL